MVATWPARSPACSIAITGALLCASWLIQCSASKRSLGFCSALDKFVEPVECGTNFVHARHSRPFFLQLHHQRWHFPRTRELRAGGLPVNCSLARRQMLVLVSMIIVNVYHRHAIPHQFQSRLNSSFDMRMPRVKAELHLQVCLLNELMQRRWAAQLVSLIFDRDGHAAMLREYRKVLERRKCRVQLSWIGRLPPAADVLHEIREWYALGDL